MCSCFAVCSFAYLSAQAGKCQSIWLGLWLQKSEGLKKLNGDFLQSDQPM